MLSPKNYAVLAIINHARIEAEGVYLVIVDDAYLRMSYHMVCFKKTLLTFHDVSSSKTVYFLILFFISFNVFSQKNDLIIADLKPLSYSFKIENNKVIGPGADTLKSIIERSQFFMLGEEHRSPQISKLTNILLPYFANAGYDNFALEVGPFTADIIGKEIKKNNSLYGFNYSFYLENNDIPIPFFDGKDDDEFIKTASKNKFKLWGLDQEYLTAPLFLLDEVFKKSANKDLTKDAYLKAKAYLKKN